MPYSVLQQQVNRAYGRTATPEEEKQEELTKSVSHKLPTLIEPENDSNKRLSYQNIMFRLNPFLNKKDGSLINENVNYQKVLDESNVNEMTKKFIEDATGLKRSMPAVEIAAMGDNGVKTGSSDGLGTSFDGVNGSDLLKMDVTQMPKLSVDQISKIISTHFGKSTVITPADAQGIYDAQKSSGMSALAILAIGGLESGYGTSNIAKAKNNIWGWGATNKNPSGNAKTFSQMSQGALEFANSYLNTFYNKYGAKSIYDAGTGNNPAGMGYAYYDSGGIDSTWATKVGSIMEKFYRTAGGGSSSGQTAVKSSSSSGNTTNITSNNSIVNAGKNYMGTPYVWGGESMSEGGMDCSGFVYNALRDAGYNVGRDTAQGYRSYGKRVDASQLQPGDLIFYGNSKGATHIAIYAGNGQIIHSSGGSSNTKSNPGKGVSVQNLNYRSDFLEARRM